jgi:hypothetical protein
MTQKWILKAPLVGLVGKDTNKSEITLCTILLMCIMGMMDDILGWKKGIRQWKKSVLTLFAAMPMVVINAGHFTRTSPTADIYGELL